MNSFHVYSLQSKKSKTQKGANTKHIEYKKYKNQNEITKKHKRNMCLATKRGLKELTLIVTEQRIK